LSIGGTQLNMKRMNVIFFKHEVLKHVLYIRRVECSGCAI